MHPLLGDRRRWRLLFAALGGIGAAIGLLVHAMLGVPWIDAFLFGVPIGFAAAPLYLSAWYIGRATPLGKTPIDRVLLTALSAASVMGSLWALAGWGWWRLLRGLEIVRADVSGPLVPLLVAVGALDYLLSLAVTYAIEAVEASAAAGQRALQSQVAQRDAELAALRAQIDPHFLFNSLNSVAGLIGPDPARARMMCQLLADFLRDSLALGSAARIALGREVALAEQYLQIEHVRFGPRLAVTTAVAPDTTDVPVPPLLLQPLVENAVRHGVATRLEGGEVHIATRLAGARAVITVTNPRDADGARPGTGLGLSIVRRRLQAAFGDEAALVLEPHETRFVATVTIPRLAPEASHG